MVNNKLFELGHKAYRFSKIECIHRSLCRNPLILLQHHYQRGRGFGRILWEIPAPAKTLGFRFRRILWLVTKYPAKRIFLLTGSVFHWGAPVRRFFLWSFPLVVAGTLSAALGAVIYLLRPGQPGKTT